MKISKLKTFAEFNELNESVFAKISNALTQRTFKKLSKIDFELDKALSAKDYGKAKKYAFELRDGAQKVYKKAGEVERRQLDDWAMKARDSLYQIQINHQF